MLIDYHSPARVGCSWTDLKLINAGSGAADGVGSLFAFCKLDGHFLRLKTQDKVNLFRLALAG